MANPNRDRAKTENTAKKPGTRSQKPGASETISRKRVRRAVTHSSPVTSLTVFRHGMQHMRQGVFTALAAVLGLSIVLGFGVISLPKLRDAESGDIAEVNGHTVERAAFETAAQRYAESPYAFMMGGGPTQALTIRNMLLDQEVERYVKLDAAKREGNRVGRKQFQDRINQILDQQIQQARDQYKDEKEFTDRFLKRKWQVNTRAELRSKLQGNLNDDALNSINEEILLDNLQKTVEKRAAAMPVAKAKPDEVELHARAIEVKIDPKKHKEAEAQQLAQQIAAKLKGGADFAAVARESSEDEATKAKGGDMGWLGKNGFYPSQLSDPAFALKENTVSDPIKTPTGYYILRVEGRRFSPSRYWQSYIDDLKKKAKITIHDPAILAYRKTLDLEAKANQQMAQMAQAKDDAARKKAADEQKKVNQQIIDVLAKALPKVTAPDVRAAMFYRIGDLQNQSGNVEKAAEAFGNAVSAKLTTDALMALGDAQMVLKRTQPALDSYRNASTMSQDYSSPQNQQIHMRLEGAFRMLNQPDLEAKEKSWLDEYKKQNPNGGGMMFPGMGGNFTVR